MGWDEVELSVKGSAQSAADVSAINAAMNRGPDVVIVIGDAGDVEPVIVGLGAHTHKPKVAVVGTNAVGGTYPNPRYQQCVIMPIQWDSTSTAKDPLIGWDAASFKAAIEAAGLTATYQIASAGASAV